MKNFNKLVPYIKHDLKKAKISVFKIFFDKGKGKGYELLLKDGEIMLFTIEELLVSRKAFEAVAYCCECHCLFLKYMEVSIYDYYLHCQIETLLEKGFICADITLSRYKSKKAMNNAILARLKKKNPNLSSFTLKEFSEYYDIPWFLEVR